MRALLAFALVLTGALPVLAEEKTQIAATDSIAAAPLYRIQKIRLVGVASLDTSVIKGTLKFAEGESMSSELLADRQRESIRALLATSLVSDASLEFKELGGGAVEVVVTLKEVPLCGSVSFQGQDDLSEKDLREVVRIGDGSLLSQGNLGKDKQALLKLYHGKGFLLAQVEPKLGTPDASGKVPLSWTIEEKSKVRVGKITFLGNQRLSRKKLLGAMVTKEKRWWRSGEFSQNTLQVDLQKIRDLYREKGYLDAGVDSHQVTYRPDGKRLDITLHLHEGRRYYRGRIAFTGQDVLSERALRAQATMDSGAVLNQKKLELEETNIQNAYREEGRLGVQINAVKTYRDSVVDILYMIKEGGPYSVGQVVVEGNTKTRDKVIRRELRLFPGDLFRQSLMMRSYREVMQLNFFDNVVPDIRPSNEEGVVDVVFKVAEKEKGTGTFSAGGAYSQYDGFVLTLGLQVPNVFGTGRRVDANLDYGSYKKSVRLGVTEPWFMDSPTRVGVSGFWTHQAQQSNADYDYVTYGFDLNLGRRLTWPDDYFSAGLGYGFSSTEYQGLEDDRMGLLRKSGLESSLSASVTRDDKDLPLFPTSGSTFQLSYRRVGGFLGGQFDYHQGSASAKWWFPTVGKFVLGLESQMGVLGGDVMQASSLYLSGGLLGYQGKLRGYDAGSIGRYRMGRSFLSSTAELRYPVADQLFYLITFMDAGNVFGQTLQMDVDRTVHTLPNPVEEIDLGNLKRDWGFGFRLNIPMMGILGFDFAWGLDDGEGIYGQSIPNTGMHANFTIEQPF